MALQTALRELQFSPNQVKHLGDTIDAAITATGTTQGGAYQLTKTINNITTCAAGVNDAVKLPDSETWPQTWCIISNNSGTGAQIFPYSGQAIMSLGANNPSGVDNGKTHIFIKLAGFSAWLVCYGS